MKLLGNLKVDDLKDKLNLNLGEGAIVEKFLYSSGSFDSSVSE